MADKTIPALISSDYFTISLETGTISPADSTTYYFGTNRITPNTTATNFSMNLGFAYTITDILITASSNTTAGTTEASTLQIRNITQATSTSVGTFTTEGSATLQVSTKFNGLSISVAAGDSICAQWDTPAWATNPVGVLLFGTLICTKTQP